MAETPSTMLPLQTPAPDFTLLDVQTETMRSLAEFTSPVGTVIMFICNHCPYVKYILPKLVEVAADYQARGIQFVAINSNDVVAYPADSPANMRQLADDMHLPFPYLFDETQQTAKDYRAACTPDFFVFDSELKCVYRGRFDDATPGNKHESTGIDLSKALNNLLVNAPISPDQKPSLGCNIKWKR